MNTIVGIDTPRLLNDDKMVIRYAKSMECHKNLGLQANCACFEDENLY